MPIPRAEVRVWLDDNDVLHAATPDGREIEVVDDPWLRTILQDQRDKLRAEEKLALRERERNVRPFDCPLTDSRCTEGGLCSRTFCVRRQREEQKNEVAARRQEERARAVRGSVKGRKVRNLVVDIDLDL
jgi:hypothetical protein